jgi:hypothetical protein
MKVRSCPLVMQLDHIQWNQTVQGSLSVRSGAFGDSNVAAHHCGFRRRDSESPTAPPESERRICRRNPRKRAARGHRAASLDSDGSPHPEDSSGTSLSFLNIRGVAGSRSKAHRPGSAFQQGPGAPLQKQLVTPHAPIDSVCWTDAASGCRGVNSVRGSRCRNLPHAVGAPATAPHDRPPHQDGFQLRTGRGPERW